MSRLEELAEKQPSDPDHQCARGSFLSEKLLLVSSHHLTIQERERIPRRGVAELQTGVGTVLRNKGIWLSNREDVVVGHYTLTPPRKTNPRRRLSHGEAFYSAWLRLAQTRR